MKHVEYSNQEGQWWPCNGTTIDMRGSGYKSKRAVRDSLRELRSYGGQHIVPKFLKPKGGEK
jgi:hypothetical protein